MSVSRAMPRLASKRAPEILSNADVAWMLMDRPTNRMIITGLMITGTPLARAELVRILDERLLKRARFANAPRRSSWRRAPPRVPTRAEEHVHAAALPPPGGEAELRAFIADRMQEPLPRDRPLWQVHVIEHYDGGTALVWRLHHALADGVALMRTLVEAADEPPSLPSRRAPPGKPFAVRRAYKGARSLIKLLLLPMDRRTALKGRLSGTKSVAWSRPFPIPELRAAAIRAGATINDLLMSSVAAGLHRVLASNGARTPGSVRALVPVDLRAGRADDSLGNRFGLVYLKLPVSKARPPQRLAKVKRRMDKIKRTPESGVAFGILSVIGLLSARLSAVAIALFGMKASLVLTNVAGPRQTIALGGAPIKDLFFWVPQAGGIGVGVSLLSYAGNARVGITCDVARVPDARLLVEGVEEELLALT